MTSLNPMSAYWNTPSVKGKLNNQPKTNVQPSAGWNYNYDNPFRQELPTAMNRVNPTPIMGSFDSIPQPTLRVNANQAPLEWSEPAAPQPMLRVNADQNPLEWSEPATPNTPIVNTNNPTPVAVTPMDVPFATWENIQPYFNPYYQHLIDQGTRAIEASAASRGRLRSTRTEGEIGNWAVNAGAHAYDAAMGNFMADRMGMYDIFKDSRDFDFQNLWTNNAFNYQAYRDQIGDYNSAMGNQQALLTALASMGPEMAKVAAQLAGSTGTANANMYMAMAQLMAMLGMSKGQQQGNFISDLISLGELFGEGGLGGIFGGGGG